MKITAFTPINVKPLSQNQKLQANSKNNQPAFGLKFYGDRDFVEMLPIIDKGKAKAVMRQLKRLNYKFRQVEGDITIYGTQIKVALNGYIPYYDMIPNNEVKVDSRNYAENLGQLISATVDHIQTRTGIKKVNDINLKYGSDLEVDKTPTLSEIKELNCLKKGIDEELKKDRILGIPVFMGDVIINKEVIDLITSNELKLIEQVKALTESLNKSKIANKVSIGIECMNKYDLSMFEVPRLSIQYIHPKSRYAIKESYEIPVNHKDFAGEIEKGVKYLEKPFKVHDAETEAFYKRVAHFKKAFGNLNEWQGFYAKIDHFINQFFRKFNGKHEHKHSGLLPV